MREKVTYKEGEKFIVRAANYKTGTTSNGNKWHNVGCVNPTPPGEKGVWHNYYSVQNDRNKPQIAKDMETMGIISLDPFAADRRLVIIEYGFHEFFKDIRIMKVTACANQPDITKVPSSLEAEADPF